MKATLCDCLIYFKLVVIGTVVDSIMAHPKMSIPSSLELVTMLSYMAKGTLHM